MPLINIDYDSEEFKLIKENKCAVTVGDLENIVQTINHDFMNYNHKHIVRGLEYWIEDYEIALKKKVII